MLWTFVAGRRRRRPALLPLAVPLLLAAAALSACTPTPDPGPLNPAVGPVIGLAVERLDVESPPAVAPVGGTFIDQRRSKELRAAGDAFLRSRLQAAGGSEWAKAVVEEASLVEASLPVAGGFLGTFKREPAYELRGALGARVAIVDGLGVETAFASARVERRRTVLERTSVMERDREAQVLTRSLLDDLSKSLQQSIDENLPGYRAGAGAAPMGDPAGSLPGEPMPSGPTPLTPDTMAPPPPPPAPPSAMPPVTSTPLPPPPSL
jgi:hypothetical protein